jgi:D-alanyl-D-alanine carboxypeptidase (penicillin-binding protein 5/6)
MIRATFSLTAASLLLASAAPAKAPPFETPAKVAYLMDLTSGARAAVEECRPRMPPASMAKMMTTNVAFELIKKGDLQLDKMCTVRPETWQKWHGPAAGSTMFLSPERAGQRRESAPRHRHPVGQ